MAFSEMKVGVRLGLGFALVILAGLVVAILGRIELASIEDDVRYLVTDRVVKVGQFNQVKSHLQETALAVDLAVLSSDEQVMQAQKARIDGIRARNSALLEQLQRSIRSPEGRAVLEKLQQMRPLYNTSIDQALVLAQAQFNDQASTVLLEETQPLLARYLGALDEGIQLQERAMNHTAQAVQASTAATGKILLAIAALAALIGAAIGWVLTRSITQQLGGEPG